MFFGYYSSWLKLLFFYPLKIITATSTASMAISKAVIMHRDPKARQADEACVLITMAPLAMNMTAPAARMGSSTFFATCGPINLVMISKAVGRRKAERVHAQTQSVGLSTVPTAPAPTPRQMVIRPNMAIFKKNEALPTSRTIFFDGTCPPSAILVLFQCGMSCGDIPTIFCPR